MFFPVYTNDECEIIVANKNRKEYQLLIERTKSFLKTSFKENYGIDFKDKNIRVDKFDRHHDTFRKTRRFSFADVLVVDFVICIRGEGMLIYDETIDEVKQLKPGQGTFIIGEMGYAFLNIKPTYYNSTYVSEDTCSLTFMVEGSFQLNQEIDRVGDIIENYGSQSFKERLAECDLLKVMYNKINSIENFIVGDNSISSDNCTC